MDELVPLRLPQMSYRFTVSDLCYVKWHRTFTYIITVNAKTSLQRHYSLLSFCLAVPEELIL